MAEPFVNNSLFGLREWASAEIGNLEAPLGNFPGDYELVANEAKPQEEF